MKRVVLESPYAGDIAANTEYARACMHDCLLRGEAPIASHLLYTQRGILRDDVPHECALGIEAGLIWAQCAEKSTVYIDRGISGGMKAAVARAEKEGRPVEYRTLRPTKIITLTGPSGAGKTSIVKKILELRPEMHLVVSLTSRAPRSSDLPGEYQYYHSPIFFLGNDAFLWSIGVHDDHYGTLKISVNEALVGSVPSLMILTPDVITPLRAHAETQSGGGVLSFYISPPPVETLRARLSARGDDAAAVERRIADCLRWNEEARASGIPYIFVSNEEEGAGIEHAAAEIVKYAG